jgi:hypothetical protein
VDLADLGGGTITFDTNQFAVSYGTTTGLVENPDRALGYDLGSFARVGGENYGSEDSSLELIFGGNLVNEAGVDLWFYEIGWVDNVTIEIDGTKKTYLPTDTTVDNSTGKAIRLAKIDLGDWGYGTGSIGFDTITIHTERFDMGWHTPDVAAVAVRLAGPDVHSVPLPSAALMGIGLLAVALAGRTRRRRRHR